MLTDKERAMLERADRTLQAVEASVHILAHRLYDPDLECACIEIDQACASIRKFLANGDPAAEYANDIEDEPIRNAMKESIRRAYREKAENG